MAGVVDELKGKLAELTGRLEAIGAEAAAREVQRQAFEMVIACYDPHFTQGVATELKPRRSSDVSTPTKRVTALLKNRNPRHIALEILRKSDGPVAAAEVAQRFVAQEQLGGATEGPNSHLTSRFATILDGLRKQELVRFELSGDAGNRRLWEINR
jgi:hypothetical protein